MSVNHEVKGNLARLLATEDLVVEHKNCETAQFNVHTRVLTLPMWEKASGTVYDLLVGHEVGHALFTPDEDWSNIKNIPRQFVNVVEDARVEKLMKRKYAGLNKTFYKGYQELHEGDFFSIGNDDVSDFNLADKANLYFKIGSFLNFNFEGEEKEIIQQIGEAETFEEVLEASERLYNYCKIVEEDEIIEENNNIGGETEVEDTSSSIDTIGEVFTPKVEDKKENQENSSTQNSSSSSNSNLESNESTPNTQKNSSDKSSRKEVKEPQVKTMNSFESAVKELVEEQRYDNTYVEVPKVYLDEIIIKNDIIHQMCDNTWKENIENFHDIFFEVDKSYKEFKKTAQKEVNYLIKEFERKKSANSYARASVAKTGVLDCTKLHTYKYNEDLFKKITTLPNGKNHGLIFILDWSGSMSHVMLDTIKQLYNLIWFCKKINIPFDVYAFNSEWKRKVYDPKLRYYTLKNPLYDKKENVFCIDDGFALFNFLTSSVNSRELEKQMITLYRLASSFNYYSVRTTHDCPQARYSIPSEFTLSSTPLNETLVALHEIIPQFKKKTKAQKVHCIILTDGEAHTLNRHVMITKRYDRDPYLGVVGVNFQSTFLRDRKLGTTYAFNVTDYYHFSEVLLRNLKDKFSDVNFIGIRIITNREANSFIRRYINDFHEHYLVTEMWKKQKSFTLKTAGYHAYFGISSSALNTEVDFEVCENATKTQIKSAFTKSLKGKKMNKKILNEFIGLIS